MITAKSEITVENMTAAWRVYLRHVAKSLSALPFIGLCGLVASFCGFFVLPNEKGFSFLMIVLSLWLTLAIPFLKRQFSTTLQKQPIYGDTYRFTLHEECLEVETVGSESRISWSILPLAVATDNGILIMPNTVTFYWMQREGFDSEEQFFDAVELVSRNVMNTKRVGV